MSMLYKNRLLLIDASDSARLILFKELNARLPDLEVIACSTAKEALTAAKRFEFKIITTGLSLPDMDGQEMIRLIRDIPKNCDTPIFVVSGDTQTYLVDDVEDITITSAVTAYFDKAEGHHALVNFIANFLHRDKSRSANILYVDSSATSSAIISSILEKNHFNFEHYKTATEAFQALKSAEAPFDLLITDLNLNGDMPGFELIQAVRTDLGLDYLHLPILLLTVEPGEGERTDFTGIFGAGTNDFLTKPISEDILMERVLNLINIKRQALALSDLD